MQPAPNAQHTRPYQPASPGWLAHLGSTHYFRMHVSAFMLGSVLLLMADLLIANGNVFADRAIGLWFILIVVHAIVLVIARLLAELMKPEVVPVVVVRELGRIESPPGAAAGTAPDAILTTTTPPESSQSVPWTVATHDAWLTRDYREDPASNTTPAPSKDASQ